MTTIMKDVLVTNGNQAAFNEIAQLTAKHDKPINLFIYGPANTGKTTMMEARCNELDNTTYCNTMHTHPEELAYYLTDFFEYGQDYLGNLGETDVLFIDSFDDAFNEKNIGAAPEGIGLLIKARQNAKDRVFDNVILARKPKSEYSHEKLGDILDSFVEMEIQPFTYDDKKELFRRIQRKVAANNKNVPSFSDDAIELFAECENEQLNDAIMLAKALMLSSDLKDEAVINRAMIEAIE